jgi:pimeloyl-ACP methyl ester carboxylesterase
MWTSAPAIRQFVALNLLWLLYSSSIVSAQLPPAAPQCNDFNSSVKITASQQQAAGIDQATADNVAVAVNYERSNWAGGSVNDDDFYRVPPNTGKAPAGTLLKVQVDANTSLYTLPPNTALSRILFQTKTINGTLEPASAYVLWPYMPRTMLDGTYPVIGWGHGSASIYANCAPSHYRYLLYQFAVPYTLALQGYVVVAPDFLGLGVGKDANGKPIRHLQLSNPQNANDIFYSVQAAQSAFKMLSKKFVVMGHSEGGGAAWAAAERQAAHPVDGYLGAIAGSPITNFLAIAELVAPAADGSSVLLVPGLTSLFPTFNPSDILTPAGLKISAFMSEIQGCNAVIPYLLLAPGLAYTNWTKNYYVQSYQNLSASGGKNIAGPLLVLQGDADTSAPAPFTTAAVSATCKSYPNSQLEYIIFANVTHVPVMYASQRIWLSWIEDRFAGVAVSKGCAQSNHTSARPYQYYQADTNWYLEYATQLYETF